MCRDDVALLREGTQIDRSSLAQEQVDHSTASLADEMIVLAGLGIESGSLCVQKEGADLTLVDETVKVAINGGETDPRQLFVNPLVDLMGERVSVIALESFEHLLQLACRTFAGGPPHGLTSKSCYRADRIEPSVGGVIKSTVSCQAIPRPLGYEHETAVTDNPLISSEGRSARCLEAKPGRIPWDLMRVGYSSSSRPEQTRTRRNRPHARVRGAARVWWSQV